jgi:hypothetical protein
MAQSHHDTNVSETSHSSPPRMNFPTMVSTSGQEPSSSSITHRTTRGTTSISSNTGSFQDATFLDFAKRANALMDEPSAQYEPSGTSHSSPTAYTTSLLDSFDNRISMPSQLPTTWLQDSDILNLNESLLHTPTIGDGNPFSPFVGFPPSRETSLSGFPPSQSSIKTPFPWSTLGDNTTLPPTSNRTASTTEHAAAL